MSSERERRARAATTLIFFLTGFVYAAWATRIPALKAELHLSAGELGLAILGLEAGAIAGLPAGGALVARAGSPRALRAGFAVYPLGLVCLALVPGLAALAAALALMAASSSVVDVAMNAQGVELERRRRRPLLSSLHAGHPLGLAAGGLLGSGAAAAGVPPAVHFGAVGGGALAVGVAATAVLVREPAPPDGRPFARPNGPLLGLGLIAFCAFLLEGAAYNWSAVHLSTEHGAGEGLAAAAFTVFALALAAGRLLGDRLVERFGRARVVRICGGVAAAGSALVVAGPGAALGIAGWAVFGLGLAALAPTVLGAAPAAGGGSPAVAIAAVTTVGYLGSFTGPPLVGLLAEAGSLSAALGLLVAVSAAMVMLAPRVPG
jgi:MFS family permease